MVIKPHIYKVYHVLYSIIRIGDKKKMTKQCSKRYKEYLLSPEWQQIRHKVLTRDHFTCVLCGSVDSYDDLTEHNVHHVIGKYRFHEQGHENSLVTLCGECHRRYHETMDARDWLKENKDLPFTPPAYYKCKEIVDKNQSFIDRYFRLCSKRGCFK